MRQSNQQRLVFALLFPTIIMVLTALVLYLLSINNKVIYIIIVTSMLVGNFVLIYVLDLSYEDLGLQYDKSKILLHIFEFIILTLFIFITLYIAHIDITMDISGIVFYDVLFFTIAAFADELYFSGIIYHLLQVWDEKTAFIGSSLIYGFWTIQVGYTLIFANLLLLTTFPIPLSIIERLIFALSLCVIRYTTKMIYLAIPAHILINFHNLLMVNANVSAQIITINYAILVLAIALILVIFVLIERKKNNNLKKGVASQFQSIQ